MTISTQIARAQYAGNGVTTSFSIPFEFLTASPPEVIYTDATGVDVQWVQGTHYTLTGGGAQQPATGSIVALVAPALSTKLTILRAEALTQTADYIPNDPFPASAHEKALDRLSMQVQMLAERTNRAVSIKKTSSDTALEFPSPDANKVIGWNSAGDGLVNKQFLPGDSAAGATGALIFAADAASDVRSIVGLPATDMTPVATRTALKLLDTSQDPLAYLQEAGREGVFVWTLGNFATLIAADTQEGLFVKASTVAASVGAWVRQFTGRISPKWFGALPSPLNATTALAGMVAVVNALPLSIWVDALYESTAPLAFACQTLDIEGNGAANCGFYFRNSDGIQQTTLANSSTLLGRFALLTDQAETKTGFTYIGGTVSDWKVSRHIYDIVSSGKHHYDTGTPSVDGWLADFDLTDGDFLRFNRVICKGMPENTALDYARTTYGYKISGSTHVLLEDCHADNKYFAIDISGQSENSEILRGSYLNNAYGVELSGITSSAGNDHNITNAHFVCRRRCLGYGSATVDMLMNSICNNLLFSDGSNFVGFTFILVAGNNNYVANNYCHKASSDDAVASGHIGVNVLNGTGNIVTNNTFSQQKTAVQISVNATGTVVGGNVTADSGTTIVQSPCSDLSTTTQHFMNYGDRPGSWGNSINHKVRTQMAFEVNYGGSGSAATNYLQAFAQVSGVSPGLSALGTDANVDIRLLPKGTGNVRFGTYVATPTAVIGYVTIKDAAGTARKLAVIS